MESKFKIGDKVDFVNDYGVIFRNRIITDIEVIDNRYRYQVVPNDTPWFLKYEKNLYLEGTYQEPNLDLELNNGDIAKFRRYTDGFSGEAYKIYTITNDTKSFDCALLDGKLYSISVVFEEPICPLDEQFQPI